MIDPESAKELNLLHGSPPFVLKHLPDGRAVVIRPEIIPVDDSMYSVAGESVLPNGVRVPSVFVIENGGGNLVKVYWHIHANWFEPSDSEVPQLLDASREELFPFDWSYSVPVENDIYHSSG